eukprot:s1172_g9.t1
MAAAMTDTNSPWTYNVLCGLCATGFYCTGAGLFQMTVLPSFILLVGGSNFDVGFAEGLQGLTNLIFALPVGYIADKWSRRACIRIGASLSLLSGACLLLAVLLATADNSTAFAILCAALGLQGICDGIMNGPLVALMDDSCPAGRRSDVETMNAVVYGAASSVGPLVGLVVFLYAGNTWSLSSMKIVIALGVLICQMAIFPCFFMDDRRALGECSEAVHLQERLVGDSGGARELRCGHHLHKSAGFAETLLHGAWSHAAGFSSALLFDVGRESPTRIHHRRLHPEGAEGALESPGLHHCNGLVWQCRCRRCSDRSLRLRHHLRHHGLHAVSGSADDVQPDAAGRQRVGVACSSGEVSDRFMDTVSSCLPGSCHGHSCSLAGRAAPAP